MSNQTPMILGKPVYIQKIPVSEKYNLVLYISTINGVPYVMYSTYELRPEYQMYVQNKQLYDSGFVTVVEGKNYAVQYNPITHDYRIKKKRKEEPELLVFVNGQPVYPQK